MTYCPICGCVLNEGNVSNRWYYGKRVCNHCEKVIKKIKNFNKKSRRRFAKKNASDRFEQITLKDFYKLNKFFGGNETTFVSAVTGRELDFEEISFDHIIPVCKGGSNNIHNLVIMEKSINENKDDKDIEELHLAKDKLRKINEWQSMK